MNSKMEGEGTNLIRVKLIKQRMDGLGFLIKPRKIKPHVSVSALVAGGMAEQSGLVYVGDVVIRVNEIDVSDMSYENAVELLKALPVDAPVALLLRGPDGYSTHLETTFQENGIPKTIRVTRPLSAAETLVGRLKRTFSRSRSSSPSRNNLRQARVDNHIVPSGRNHQTTNNYQESNCFMCPLERHYLTSPSATAQKKTVTDAGSQTLSSGQSSPNLQSTNKCNDASPKIVVTRTESSSSVEAQKSVEKLDLNKNAMSTSYHSSDFKDIKIQQNSDEIQVTISDNIDNENRRKSDLKENDTKVQSVQFKVNEQIPNGHVNGNGLLTSDDDLRGKDEINPHMALSPGSQKKNLEKRRGSASSPKKYVRLHNMADEKLVITDTLHNKSTESVGCGETRCIGSLMFAKHNKISGEPRAKDEVIMQAKDFIEQYYTSIKRVNTPAHKKRWQDVQTSIQKMGTYELTTNELTFGAKTAWRNAPRCIGRIQWTKLQVFDARHITTARGMFEAICNHIKYGTNKGNIRSAITIFPPRTDGKHDYRVWNAQLIRYAGYKQPDGSVIGDPSNVEFTEICQKMGWKGKGGMFDVLPLVLQANGMDPEMFEIPPDLVLEVHIKHPKFPWMAEMGLKWYALPAVSGMCFDCGGLEFTAIPFNGWYMGTEIGARDFCDVQRYNLAETIGNKMGLDTRKSSSLWKDTVLVETNIAVLHSFQQQGVTITDHHAASESFMKFQENELKARGGCPADWVWVVPPMSGSITPVFHQEMLLYKLKPSYEYQDDPWKTHIWKKDRDKTKSIDRPKRKFGFRELARAVKFSAKLMGKALARRVKCTILYATETGKSERFAKNLCEIFKHAFDARVLNMEEYDVIDLEHEALVLIVTSTFGNGDPPQNGEAFAKSLHEMKSSKSSQKINGRGEPLSMSYFKMSTASESDTPSETESSDKDDNLDRDVGPLANVHYSVFGLGSRAYPYFCAFGHYVDNMMHALDGMRITKMAEGDELCGQEESFREWAQEVFKAACETFCVGDDNSIKEATGALSKTDFSWTPGKFRLTPANVGTEPPLEQSLSKVHNKAVLPCRLLERIQLQSKESNRQTILVRLDTDGASELTYNPGDHVAVFPANSGHIVDGIISRLHNAPSHDQIIKVEFMQEKTTPLGTMKSWEQFDKLPMCTLKTAFTRFLDITTPPSINMLKLLASQATRDVDKTRIENLANDIHEYEDWKQDKNPNIMEVLEEFPSLKVNPTLLMTQLPLLQQRYYSISSSPKAQPGEIHATIAIVRYNTMGGVGPEHEGVCSSWLNRCEVGDSIPCAVRTAPLFHLPDDATLPVIMVGPGTGIAPFRSFWHQRKIDKEMLPVPHHGNTTGWGDMDIYFGCRQSTMDHIYKDELEACKKDNVMNGVNVALSREPGQPKTYVQDLMKKNADRIFEQIVKRGGHFYVCGDVGMASDVTTTLGKILQQKGNMSPEASRNFLLKLREANRFHEDIFGVDVKAERDQAKKAWKYINSTKKPKQNEETIVITTERRRMPRGTPRPPPRQRQPINSVATNHNHYDSNDSLSPEN